MTCARTAAGPPRVAYGVGRSVGTAVVRNRLRRRLRAVVREEVGALAADHVYLVSAGPAASAYTYRELRSTVRAILADLREGPA